MQGYEVHKSELAARLRRIEGQVRGLARMVEDDRYCIDILTQVSSVTRALQGVGLLLLDDHVHHCVRDALEDGAGSADEKIDEAMQAIERLVKT